MLSIKLHFLKLFVQIENGDGSRTQSESRMEVLKDHQMTTHFHLCTVAPGILDLLEQLHLVPSLSQNILVSNSQKKH